MKRKKVIAVTAIVFTCATISSCGKTSTETVKAEPIIEATEQIIMDTEEIIEDADLSEGDALTLEPTTDANGNTIYPDYPEKYVKFEPIEPVELWCIEKTSAYSNPNMAEGKLVKGGEFEANSCHTYDATCEIEGDTYYRFVNSTTNQVLIVLADCLSETPPSDTASSASSDAEYVGGFSLEGVSPEIAEQIRNNYVEWTPEAEQEAWSQVPEDLLDAAANMQFE